MNGKEMSGRYIGVARVYPKNTTPRHDSSFFFFFFFFFFFRILIIQLI